MSIFLFFSTDTHFIKKTFDQLRYFFQKVPFSMDNLHIRGNPYSSWVSFIQYVAPYKFVMKILYCRMRKYAGAEKLIYSIVTYSHRKTNTMSFFLRHPLPYMKLKLFCLKYLRFAWTQLQIQWNLTI